MDPPGNFNLVYFDAFAPDKQPQLWSTDIFSKIYSLTLPGAVLVSYSSRGSVRRNLDAVGFTVEKVPGPPGKIEMIRAARR
jgi:tRNA U34 5-methylaminomethyl-2-thiouridine-forming methyltransferase MnmC